MNKYIIGIDPDSVKHGVAVYTNGILANITKANTVEIVKSILERMTEDDILFSIEDVCSNNFVYARNNKGNKAVTSKIAMSIGRCQQSQQELQHWLKEYNIPYVLHKPQKGNWAKNKKQFEAATGWVGQSNEDTRSAAYFGFLALNQ